MDFLQSEVSQNLSKFGQNWYFVATYPPKFDHNGFRNSYLHVCALAAISKYNLLKSEHKYYTFGWTKDRRHRRYIRSLAIGGTARLLILGRLLSKPDVCIFPSLLCEYSTVNKGIVQKALVVLTATIVKDNPINHMHS